MTLRTELITPPAALPVTPDDLRAHLWTIYPEKTSDQYLEMLIKAAVAHVETITWRRLISQTWRLYLSAWPESGAIEIPYGRCSAVEFVRWLDDSGTDHELVSGTDYIPAIVGDYPSVLAPSAGWPSGALFDADSIRVQFVSGFGGPDDVPPDIRHAIMLLVAHWYEQREAVIVGTTVRKVPFAVDALLFPWRMTHA